MRTLKGIGFVLACIFYVGLLIALEWGAMWLIRRYPPTGWFFAVSGVAFVLWFLGWLIGNSLFEDEQ